PASCGPSKGRVYSGPGKGSQWVPAATWNPGPDPGNTQLRARPGARYNPRPTARSPAPGRREKDPSLRKEIGRRFMRYPGLSLVPVLLAGAPLTAQPPAPAPTLDAILARWEQVMTGVTSLSGKVVRTKKDAVYQVTEVFEGDVKYQKPNLAYLKM